MLGNLSLAYTMLGGEGTEAEPNRITLLGDAHVGIDMLGGDSSAFVIGRLVEQDRGIALVGDVALTPFIEREIHTFGDVAVVGFADRRIEMDGDVALVGFVERHVDMVGDATLVGFFERQTHLTGDVAFHRITEGTQLVFGDITLATTRNLTFTLTVASDPPRPGTPDDTYQRVLSDRPYFT